MKTASYILFAFAISLTISLPIDLFHSTIAEELVKHPFSAPPGMNLDEQLIEACREGNLDYVKGLVSLGASINPDFRTSSYRSDKSSPLLEAVKNGHLELVRYLATKGAVFNPDHPGASSLWGMKIRKRGENDWRLKVDPDTRAQIQKILDTIRLDRKNSNTTKVLPDEMRSAAWKGDTESIRHYLDNGASINARDNDGDTLLHTAAASGKTEIISLLLKRGANPEAPDKYGNVALNKAIQRDNIDTVKALLQGGAHVNYTRDQHSLLMQAASKSSIDIVRALLEAGADVHQKTSYGATPLSMANRWEPRPDVVRLLIEHGATEEESTSWKQLVDLLQRNDQSAAINFVRANKGKKLTDVIHAVVAQGDDVLLQLLIKKGVSIHEVDYEGFTALHHACRSGKAKVVQVLLKHGAPVNAQSLLKETPLMLAAKQGQAPILELLLQANADPKLKNWNNQSALDIALSKVELSDREPGYKTSLNLLSEQSNDSESVQAINREELLTAILKKDTPTIKKLIRNKSLLNSKDELGFTPLLWSIYSGNPKSVELLLKAEANPDLRPEKLCEHPPEHSISEQGWSQISRERKQILDRVRRGNVSDCGPPLLLALNRNCSKCVDHLLNFNANPNISLPFLQTTPLMIAATSHQKERLQTVRTLISHGANINQKDSAGQTALHHAAKRRGNDSIVSYMLAHGADPFHTDVEGHTAYTRAKSHDNKETMKLFVDLARKENVIRVMDVVQLRKDFRHASKQGDLKTIQNIVKTGADVNYGSYWGETPLSLACGRCHKKIIRYLLSKGANPNSVGYQGSTPLMLAAQHCTADVLKLLLESGGNPNHRNFKGHSTYFLAAGAGHVDNTELLLGYADDSYRKHAQENVEFAKLIASSSKGNTEYLSQMKQNRPDLNTSSSNGYTPLIWAAVFDQAEAIRLLISKGADINATNTKGQSALMWAASKGHISALKRLLSLGASVDLRDHSGSTALMWATWNKWKEESEVLLDHGAQVNARSDSGATALLFAVKAKDPKLVKLLVRRGADPSLSYYHGESLLSLATESGNKEIISLLKSSGASLGEPQQLQKQLFQAVQRKDPLAIKGLIQAGVDPNVINEEGDTALHRAMCGADVEVIRALLNLGADVNLKTDRWGPPITFAGCAVGTPDTNMREIVSLLLTHGAKTENDEGHPIALSTIIHAEHPLTVEVVLKHGASIDAQDDKGRTPLMIAADSNNTDILRLLIQYGAKTSLKNHFGKTALDIARDREYQSIIAILEDNL